MKTCLNRVNSPYLVALAIAAILVAWAKMPSCSPSGSSTAGGERRLYDPMTEVFVREGWQEPPSSAEMTRLHRHGNSYRLEPPTEEEIRRDHELLFPPESAPMREVPTPFNDGPP